VRKRAVAGSVLVSFGILTVAWQLGSANASTTLSTSAGSASGGTTTPNSSSSTTTPPSASSSSAASPSSSASPSAGGSSSGSSSAPAPATSSGLKNGTFTGSSEQTPFGNVQVALVISGGKITNVKALQLTTAGGRSVQISNYAAPILRQEVIAGQSANVSNVGGATYTSDGYLASVQSALDQAKA
jgi:uncharacterized protein with FMN-binding domain